MSNGELTMDFSLNSRFMVMSKYILRTVIIALCMFVSKEYFAQQTNPCIAQNAIRVVVLGSSTAAGSGPSTSDSTWVNRYTNHLLGINPNNEVINLAQGGYTTYRIMRTGFIPPPGRPNPDVNKNISAALALDPDAIIVNMPSNDVSSGYSYQEQIDNLDSIVAFSLSNSVPIWICTTQPKNYTNVALQQLQFDIKDSILQFYSPNTIDFWTTIALPDHSIDPLYDSGDGTHLNDAAHAILNSRVISADIPSAVYSPNSSSPDYSVVEITPNGFVGCGDSVTTISVVVANLGISDSSDVDFILEKINTFNGGIFIDTASQVGGITSCSMDTMNFIVNLYEEGIYDVLVHSLHPNDSTTENDSLYVTLESAGHPSLTPLHDTLCSPGHGLLSVMFNPQDTIFWYNAPSDSIAIGWGPNFSTGFLNNTTTFYAESVRGDLFYRDELETTLSSNINWNGAMFDVVALQNLILDSFFVKVNTLGSQQINIYTKTGSHIGFETNAAAWTLLGTTTLNVTTIDDFTRVPIGNLNLMTSDTLGVYMQMANPNSKISYQSVSAPITRATNEIEIITGSGVSTNFSNSYFPRDLNCGVYYHFGNRPEGDCTTGKIPVTVYVSNTTFDLGNDTIIDIADTLILNCPTGYTDYSWSTGATSSSIEIVANNLGAGFHYISVSFLDSLGCLKSDSIILAIADLVGLDELETGIFLYPNPASDVIHFSEFLSELKITNALGQVIQLEKGNFKTMSINHLPNGIYFLEMVQNDRRIFTKLIKKSNP